MNADEALEFVQSLLSSKNKKCLDDVQKAIFKLTWMRLRYDDMGGQEPILSGRSLRDDGSILWKYLTDVLEPNDRISKGNLKSTIETVIRRSRQQESQIQTNISINHPNADWGLAKEVLDENFYGRAEELQTLKQSILKDRRRLVAILGMGGIGKTDLSIKLGKDIQNNFDYVIWRSLENAPTFVYILMELIKVLSNQKEFNLLNNLDSQISRLLYYLTEHRCLIILDNVETILHKGERAGEYQNEFEEYSHLFQKIGEVNHQSCLILTSKEKLKNLERLEGKTKAVYFLQLPGLDWREGKKIFSAIENDIIFTGSDGEWKKLIEFYNGNPLVLELAASHIKTVFSGNISKFLNTGKQVFKGLRELLNWHFQRLSDIQKEVLYWLVINREPVSYLALQEDILSKQAQEEIPSTLQDLQRLIPLEKNADKFSLQPALMEYFTEQLIDQICHEIENKQIQILKTHALLKAQTPDYIKQTQIKLILKRIIERLQEYEIHVEEHLNNMLKGLPRICRKSYTAGNIINLFCHTELNLDLMEHDYSYLSVLQADLQGINLHDVDFSYSNLNKSIFTQSFDSIISVAFSSDGRLLAIGDTNGVINILCVNDGQQFLNIKAYSKYVRSIVFCSDNRLLASCSDVESRIQLWDIRNNLCFQTLDTFTNRIWSVDFSPDGKTLAGGGDDCVIRFWNTTTGNCLKTISGHDDWIWSVTFSPNGKLLASGSDDKSVRVWDVETGQCLNTLQGHKDRIWSVAFSPNGKLLASGSDDKTIKIWDVKTGQCLNTLQSHKNGVRSVAFSPDSDSKTLASGGVDRSVKIWDVKSANQLNTYYGYSNWIMSVTFSPDGKTIASCGDDQTIRLWNLETYENYWSKSLPQISNRIWSIAFSPDGRFLASGSNDRTIRIWELKTGKCIHQFIGHSSYITTVAFSLDGKILASGSDDCTIKLWNFPTGIDPRTFKEHTGNVRSIKFSPDGKTLASASYDKTVRLWDIKTGKSFPLHGHTDAVTSVTFEPNNLVLASGSMDRTIRLWNVHNGKCLHEIKSSRPYEGMKIIGSQGLSEAQKSMLVTLGAIDKNT